MRSSRGDVVWLALVFSPGCDGGRAAPDVASDAADTADGAAPDAVPDDPCARCDDGDPCTRDACDAAGRCASEPLPDCVACGGDGDCADADPCTRAERCYEGRCERLPATCAAPADPCLRATCQTGVGCVEVARCDDGNPCTVDVCDAGVCSNTYHVGSATPASPEWSVCDGRVAWEVAVAACAGEGKRLLSLDHPAELARLRADMPPAARELLGAGGALWVGVRVDAAGARWTGAGVDAALCPDAGPGCGVLLAGATCIATQPCTDVHAFMCEPRCDDGDPCTTEGPGSDGRCRAWGGMGCVDDDPCTADRCESGHGCRHDEMPLVVGDVVYHRCLAARPHADAVAACEARGAALASVPEAAWAAFAAALREASLPALTLVYWLGTAPDEACPQPGDGACTAWHAGSECRTARPCHLALPFVCGPAPR